MISEESDPSLHLDRGRPGTRRRDCECHHQGILADDWAALLLEAPIACKFAPSILTRAVDLSMTTQGSCLYSMIKQGLGFPRPASMLGLKTTMISCINCRQQLRLAFQDLA